MDMHKDEQELAKLFETIMNDETKLHIQLLNEMINMPETQLMSGKQALTVFRNTLQKLMEKTKWQMW